MSRRASWWRASQLRARLLVVSKKGRYWYRDLNLLNIALAREAGEQYKTTGTIKCKLGPEARKGVWAMANRARSMCHRKSPLGV